MTFLDLEGDPMKLLSSVLMVFAGVATFIAAELQGNDDVGMPMIFVGYAICGLGVMGWLAAFNSNDSSHDSDS